MSVITPVYNGEAHLSECIQSVLSQTYGNLEYTIVDNCSDDASRAIAEDFASRDERIRVCSNTEFLDVISSINRSFSLISADSKYCKFVAADDWLFSNCLEEMVGHAEKYPSVGMVSSYVLSGTYVGWDGLPYPSHVISGIEICRRRFLENVKVFGGPTASMIRSDIVREQVPFYPPENLHGDNEAYLELLKHSDFGFVHQVLSYRRRGEASRTTAYLERVRSYLLGDIEEVLHFGSHYLTDEEYVEVLDAKLAGYHRFLARSLIGLESQEFWEYHRAKMAQLGISVSYPRLAWYVAAGLLDRILNPKRTIESLFERLSGN